MTMKLPLIDPKFITLPGAEAGEVFHSFTKGLCPTCRRTVDGQRILRGGKVYMRKHCPEHGQSEALISGDAEWFLRSLTFIKPGSVPLEYSTKVDKGCPDDCGLCSDHEQHTCLPIIEVTNHCNLACPICIVQNNDNYHMSVEEFSNIIDGLVKKEGKVETINLSGGEPTVHPRFLELLDIATRNPNIGRVSIATHGLKCAADFEFCEEIAKRGAYVSLQLDAIEDNNPLKLLRGPGNHRKAKLKALENLERAGVRTTIIATVAKGVNDDRIGEIVRLLFEKDFILSIAFQPAAYVGYGGGTFEKHDPLDVLTIPDVVRLAEEQTGGLLKKSDFLPLPCSHPSCFGLTYLLRTDQGYTPFPRFLDLERYLQLITNRGTISPDDELEDAIRTTMDEMWTGANQVPDSAKILKALRQAILLLYPEDKALAMEERLRVGEGLVKTIFIHAYMDVHTFEIDRIKKCCTHYTLPDGRLIPGCAYNNLYRDRDGRFLGERGQSEIWAGEDS
jgi:uncharacterized radical SAM superfamily Fe-S cluster-containing enzyme